jgi:branched-subunit amino acid aminotransferase/4-amino-4-deoxychorismate lyase
MPSSSETFTPWLGVFETLHVLNGKPLFFVEHREELARAMAALKLTSELDLAAEAEKLPPESGRWRWIVTPEGTRTLFTAEPPPSREPVALSVSPVRVGSANLDARFKTLSYLAHAQAAMLALPGEAVLLNESGHVASAARGNIFWMRGGELFTPAHEAGCRCGVIRRLVLENVKTQQGHFPLQDLLEADEIFLTGSMKGIVPVSAIGEKKLAESATAKTMHGLYSSAVMRMVRNRLPVKHW